MFSGLHMYMPEKAWTLYRDPFSSSSFHHMLFFFPAVCRYTALLLANRSAVPPDVAAAGGYVPEFTAKRALQEAYSCLFSAQ